MFNNVMCFWNEFHQCPSKQSDANYQWWLPILYFPFDITRIRKWCMSKWQQIN